MDKRQLQKLALEAAKKRNQAKEEARSMDLILADVQKADIKRERKRKTPTKEEKLRKEYEDMLNYDKIVAQNKEPVVELKKEEKEWDVTLQDRIEYFDPDLSYEITGYRPITKDKGLDFDPKPFTEAADAYRKSGTYTLLIPGTFLHRQHWVQEFDRCKNGYTVGKYRLTGENYFFLNYFRLLSVLNTNGTEIRNEDFPGFIAKQYEYFHYLEMVRKLDMDGLAFKSRGVGASEIAASNLAHAYTFHKASYNIVTAFLEYYVENTLTKVWQELDFLNTCTEDAFRRVRMKIDTNMKKRASKVDLDRNESGWLSTIEGVTANEPRKLRGARVYSLYFEEAGSNPQLIDTYIQSRALVDILGYRVGSRFVFGTAGDTGLKLVGLKTMFFNPEDYSILPYKNKYSKSGEVYYTGYFIPSCSIWFGTKTTPGFDSRGVVDEERAKMWYESRWERMQDPKNKLKDRAEYCLSPEDAFALEGGNVFDMDKLSEQLMNIEQLKLVPPPKKVKLVWPYNKELLAVDKNAIPSIEFRDDGNILLSEMPIRDATDQVISNLYVIGVDGIDLGKDTSSGLKDVSKYAIVVFRRAFGLLPPKIVAIYKDRPDNPEDAHNTALKLALFYNAKILFEATRVSIFQHFKALGKLHYFLKRPRATVTRGTNPNLYGVPATGGIIEHQIELIQQYVFDYCDQIVFVDILDELMRYSVEAKRKFDYVAALAMALLANEDMIGKAPREIAITDKKLKTVGYYTNEYGQKVFGLVEQQPGADYQYPVGFGWASFKNQRSY